MSASPRRLPRMRRLVPALFLAGVGVFPVFADPADTATATEFLTRFNSLDQSDPAELRSLADWAEAKGLSFEAIKLLKSYLELAPEDREAFERISRLADVTPIPDNSGRARLYLEQFQKQDASFKVHVSPHYIVLYNTDPSFAVSRAALLEESHDNYFRAFRRARLNPIPLTERLVCVLFATHDQFVEYGRAVDGMQADWFGGYYSSRTNRIAFFDDRDNPAFDGARARTAELESQIAETDEKIERAIAERKDAVVFDLRRRREQLRRQIDFNDNRHDALAGLGNSAKTTHEAVHQLAFNTGLQKPGVMYPFWLSEGLATNFESDDPAAKRFGPFEDNESRRLLFQQAARADALMPLDQFVAFVSPNGADARQASVLYAHSWAFFQFLFKHRAADMNKYLRSLSGLPPGRRDPAQLRREFERAFGKIDVVERQWRHYVNRHR